MFQDLKWLDFRSPMYGTFFKTNELNIVGAQIPNVFGFQMVDGVWFSNGVQFSNDKTPNSARYSYPNNSRIPSFFLSSEVGSSYLPKFALDHLKTEL